MVAKTPSLQEASMHNPHIICIPLYGIASYLEKTMREEVFFWFS